jgi:hypothetical protein
MHAGVPEMMSWDLELSYRYQTGNDRLFVNGSSNGECYLFP